MVIRVLVVECCPGRIGEGERDAEPCLYEKEHFSSIDEKVRKGEEGVERVAEDEESFIADLVCPSSDDDREDTGHDRIDRPRGRDVEDAPADTFCEDGKEGTEEAVSEHPQVTAPEEYAFYFAHAPSI